MTRVLLMVTVGLALASFGCGGQVERPAGAQGGDGGAAPVAAGDQGMVDLAASIAREIEASPDEADAVLERHGKTRAEFEQMLYDIAADPELSRAYNQAIGR